MEKPLQNSIGFFVF